MRAAVVGGSLGGLSAALLLQDLGIEVDVYERSPAELVQRGAGIGFLPESARYLVERAGVALDRMSVATSRIRYLDRRGELVYDGLHAYRFSSWNTVYRELVTRIRPSRYHLDHEMTGWVDDGDSVEVHLAGRPPRRVDLLVCADGVGFDGAGAAAAGRAASYSGYVAWRGMVPEALLDAATRAPSTTPSPTTCTQTATFSCTRYPDRTDPWRPGHRLMNFVWYRNYLEGSDLDDVLTDDGGQRREISVPPGAASERHVAEMRAVAHARLPTPMARVVCCLPSRSCRWSTTSR